MNRRISHEGDQFRAVIVRRGDDGEETFYEGPYSKIGDAMVRVSYWKGKLQHFDVELENWEQDTDFIDGWVEVAETVWKKCL